MADGTGGAGGNGSRGPGGARGPRRPLLGGGERLREESERVSGGRPVRPPATAAEQQALLAPQAQALLDGLAALPERLRARHVVVEATLSPHYLAAGHFPDRLLQSADLYLVGTREAQGVYRSATRLKEDALTKTLLLAGPPERVRNFASLVLERPPVEDDVVWSQLREFDSLALPSPERVVRAPELDASDGELVTWEAVLSPVGRTAVEQDAWGDEAFERFAAYVASLQGAVNRDHRRRVGAVTFVPVLLTAESAREAARFNPLRALRPMPKVRPIPGVVLRAGGGRPAPIAPAPGTRPKSGERVAVFDGGVDANAAPFRGFVREHDLTGGRPRDPAAVEHGAMVTAGVLYGYAEPGTRLPAPAAFVDHYRVLPVPPGAQDFDDQLYWIIDQIRDVLRRGEHTFVHLSLGPDCAVEDDHEPHRWTAELDALASEFGLVVVSAAGNNGERDTTLGFDRVQPPGDMVNGISVGACANRDPDTRLERARYSARGHGRPGQRVAPTGVQYGGDHARGKKKARPFVGIGAGGRWAEAVGTSFAAPLATHGVLGLHAELGPEYGASHTLRAFAAHYALGRRPGHRGRDFGHGRLRESYADVWECPPNEASVIYQDQFGRGETVSLPLPVPAAGLDPDALVRVAWTIAYTSPVDPADAVDYTTRGFEMTLRPHARRYALYDAETDEYLGKVDVETQADLIASYARTRALKQGKAPLADPNWRTLRDEGRQRGAGKWETLARGEQTYAAAELFKPRIDLHHLARSGGLLLSAAATIPPLAATMVVTVTAPHGVPLYDLVRREYPQLAPLAQIVAAPRARAQARP